MYANKDAASSSAAGQSGKDVPGEVHAEKSVDKLNVREFYERFCIPNGVSVQLMDGKAVSTEKSADNSIFFTKEQFNAGLQFPLPLLFREFLHFTQIPQAYIHPNIVRVLMGYSILKGKNDIFSLAAHLSSLHLVTDLPDSTKGRAKGHVLVRGDWAGLSEHLERPFSPNRSLVLQGKATCGVQTRGTLLYCAKLAGRCPGAPGVRHQYFPRKLPKKVVSGEHFVLKDLPFYKEVRKADAQARRARLTEREERRQEGTLRKAPGDKRSAPSPPAGAPVGKKKMGIIIRSPAPSGLPSVSSSSGRLAGLNGLGPSMPAAERMALLAEEATSGPATRRSRPTRDLKSGISGRLHDRLLETIEVSCSSAQENHPEGSETEMTEDNPTDPVLVPDEGSPEEIHLFSYAELGEMLKRIPSGSDVAAPSAKMFEAAEMLVSGISGMVRQHDLFVDLLRISDHMKAFVFQRMSGEEELCSRLEQAEASLFAARRASEESAEALKRSQDDNEALRIELAEAKSRKEATDARLHEAKNEKAQLKGEVRQLQTEELEAEYQKQVDEMYLFGYRCCMKKHDIKRDVPSISPSEEENLRRKPS
ncbi:hypothetical protein CK203_105723 [Vitis vinifera]|uniref:Uncharacterized protein n=1 Tax=Vitis vinifera TaxID=29760 RepID=A0A438FKA6_VITVI|nr:hypothetical protein CK203_105723 [Vitis vinifera]